jgi:hypothetical protein
LRNRASHCDEPVGSEHSVMQAACGREMQCPQTGGIAKITVSHRTHALCARRAGRWQEDLQGSEKGAGLSSKPLPPDRLYLGKEDWRERLDCGKLARLAAPEGAGRRSALPPARAAILLIARGCHTRIGIST